MTPQMAPTMQTRCVPYSDEAIAAAAALIEAGQPVAVPTETVYGLAADAMSDAAVAAIYAAKGRPQFNPLIVHVADAAAAFAIGDFSDAAKALAAQYWPGPLTLVVPLRPESGMAALATAGLPTIGLRVPVHRAMQALLQATGKPLAAPSANASGAISPTQTKHVLRTLDGRIPLIIDDGPTECGLESTIVAVDGSRIRLLRAGPVIIEEAILSVDGAIEAPGQLSAHYAPSKPMRLNATYACENEDLIGFGEIGGHWNLSVSGNLIEAASRLFEMLHRADASGSFAIAVAPVPKRGLGIAINDRLRRAARGARG